MTEPRPFVVTADWRASYDNPIAVTAGTPLTLSGREDSWDGYRWLWAEAEGRAGWVPDSLARREGECIVAARNFAARELTCCAGDRLEGLEETHGWVWCRAIDGRTGWVPSGNLAPG